MKRSLTILLASAVALALMAGIGVAGTKWQPKAYMGVYTQTVDSELAEAFDLDQDYGAIVNRVARKSPADEAGIQKDDIIISFDGRKVLGSNELTELVRDRQPGDDIKVVVMREGKEQELTITLGKTKRRNAYSRALTPYFEGLDLLHARADRPYMGVSMSNLSEQLGEYFGVAEGEGALITEIEKDSPAEQAGLKAGDVIVTIGDEKVFDPADVTEIIGEMEPGDRAEVAVIRDRKGQTVTVELAERERDEDDMLGQFFDLRAPDIAPFEVYIPKSRSLWHSYDSDDSPLLDAESYREEMDKMQQELKELKQQLEEMREKLR